MAKECMLTFEELSAVFDYDPETGCITWKIRAGRGIRPGDEAGCIKSLRTNSRDGNTKQYRYVTFDGQSITAARLAWLLAHREWPERNVMAANGDTLDLRLDNLRLGDYTSGDRNGPLADRRMNKHVQQAYGLRRNYDLSLEEYARMLHAQNYVCAICEQPEVRLGGDGKPVALHVDHDHKTNKVRALLCYKCNSALGSMGDDPERLRAAIRYLDKHAEKDETMNIIPFNPGEAS
ncbi:endonuclease VII domain-containing protein [Telmatospirillum sp.]|uniref:endonuclease VII domain-containing protein n=1 Tax=Telmatospirillum sp. TaxID=2079197 RepID=UPI00284D3A1C|nr:endonuclease VII domain-containing protein [Telmatospirillum sp.]MDR3435412.1 endonuclease VII domain-containing protein [Telmatospirillum sp.]